MEMSNLIYWKTIFQYHTNIFFTIIRKVINCFIVCFKEKNMLENILNLSSTGFDYFVLFCIEFAIGGNETFYWEFERNFVSYFPFDICKKNSFSLLTYQLYWFSFISIKDLIKIKIVFISLQLLVFSHKIKNRVCNVRLVSFFAYFLC